MCAAFFPEMQMVEPIPPAIPMLAIRNLSAAYTSRSHGLLGKKKNKLVLKNINIEINARTIFGLTGESGSGKSTLARCILGIVDYEGEIAIDGQMRQNRRRLFDGSQVQMVFQDPGASLNPTKKIGWLLEEPLVIHRIGNKEQRSRKVDEMLACV